MSLCNICNEQMQKLLPIKFSYCPGCFHIRNESSIRCKNIIYSDKFYKQFAMYTLVRYVNTYLCKNKNKNKSLRILLIYNTEATRRNSLLDAFNYICNEIPCQIPTSEGTEDTYDSDVIDNARQIIYDDLNGTAIQIESVSIEELDSITSVFNIIIVEDSIDHLDDPIMFLNKCKNLITQDELNNLIVIQSSYNNFILDKEFNWTKETDISKNIFNTNSMKLLSTKCGLVLNNISIIDPNYTGDESPKIPGYNNYIFELSNKKTDDANLNEILLEELENDIYSEKIYKTYYLYYFKYSYTILAQLIDNLIKDQENN
jgi:hypothetical protein